MQNPFRYISKGNLPTLISFGCIGLNLLAVLHHLVVSGFDSASEEGLSTVECYLLDEFEPRASLPSMSRRHGDLSGALSWPQSSV